MADAQMVEMEVIVVVALDKRRDDGVRPMLIEDAG